MKKYIYLLAALCVFTFAGCEDETTFDGSSAIEILTADIDFPTEGGRGEVTYSVAGMKAEDVIEVKSSKKWLTVTSQSEGLVVFSVAASDESLTRSGDITIALGDDKKVVTVQQSGMQFNLDDLEVPMDPTGRETQWTYFSTTGPWPEVSETPDWLSVTLSEDGVITFKAELNLTNAFREVTVTVTSGWKTVKCHVTQEPASALNYGSFGCDANAASSGVIPLADYVVEVLPEWSFDQDGDWFTVTKAEDNGSLTIDIQQNTTGVNREGAVYIKDDKGVVISTIPVSQHFYTIDDMLGYFKLVFADDSWLWVMDKDEDETNGLKVMIRDANNDKKTEGYALKLKYIATGDGAPRISMELPQDLGSPNNRDMMLYACWSNGGYAPSVAYYDFIYSGENGAMTFDIKASQIDQLFTNYLDIDGLYLTANGGNWGWLVPSKRGCLYITEWIVDGNHDGFTDI